MENIFEVNDPCREGVLYEESYTSFNLALERDIQLHKPLQKLLIIYVMR